MSERRRISLKVMPDDFYGSPNLRGVDIRDEESEEELVSTITLWTDELGLLEDMARAYNICVDRGLLS